MTINYLPLAEKPISLVTIDSPYMLFKFFEGTGTSVFAETNIADATPASPTLEWPITNGGGINWSAKALAFTPDTTTDTYLEDPDFDDTVDTNESPFESVMRNDDAFGTQLIALTVQMSATGGPTAQESYISMGDNLQSGHPYISIDETVSGNVQLRVYDGSVLGHLDTCDVPVTSFTGTDANTFLFAQNKTSGNVMAFVNGGGSPQNTTTVTHEYVNQPPITAGRHPTVFCKKTNGTITQPLNGSGSRVASIDNLLILKSATELTASKLQAICDGLNEYKGDKPWALDGI